MKKILIPVDFSEYSQKAVQEGRKMVEAFGCSVVLLHVITVRVAAYRYNTTMPQPAIIADIVEEEKKHSEELLKAYKDSFGNMSDKVETAILEGYIAEEVIEYIKTKDIDFVIMGSHGIGSALHRNILGSVTNKVLHHAEKPVLVVR